MAQQEIEELTPDNDVTLGAAYAELNFGPPWEGIIAKVDLELTLGEIEDLGRFTARQTIKQHGAFVERVVVSWTYKDKDGDVPPTTAGVKRVSLRFLNKLSLEWYALILGVPRNLGQDSSDGQSSEPSTGSES